MSLPPNLDRVQAIKWESPAGGGTENDECPVGIDESEDALSCRGVYYQPAGGPVDEEVLIWRDGANLHAQAEVFRCVGKMAVGENPTAAGTESLAQGNQCVSSGNSSHSHGIAADSTNHSQDAWASGCFYVAGDAQASHIVLRGVTPGIARNEEIELKIGEVCDGAVWLQATRAYMLVLECVAISATDQWCAKQIVLGKTSIGALFRAVFVVTESGKQEVLASSGAKDWSMAVKPISYPTNQTRMGITFKSGSTKAVIRVACNLRMVEIATPAAH
jgi:hypothetical protein